MTDEQEPAVPESSMKERGPVFKVLEPGEKPPKSRFPKPPASELPKVGKVNKPQKSTEA